MNIRISVVMPCHDSAEYLRAAVDSVLAQTVADAELILVDDGSSDRTPSLIAELVSRARSLPIRSIRQRRAGVAAARNRGIAMARGRYILPLDADDEIDPSMLEVCARRLDAEPGCALVYPDRLEFGALRRRVRAGGFDLARMRYFNPLPYCAMYRLSLWRAIGGYRENVSGVDDWDFWIAAAALGASASHIAEPLLRHRRRPGSQMASVLARYDELFARVILNNAAVYPAHEVAQARTFVDGGDVPAFIRRARFVYLGFFHAAIGPKGDGCAS